MKGKDLVTLSVLLHVFMSFLACNDQPLTRIPPKTVVPYPTQMAISGDTLWVSGANADGKYSYGRLMGLSLKKIFLQPEKSDEPIDLSAVLDSNTLIPSDIGKISIANDILVFASLASGKIYAQKLMGHKLSCSDPDAPFEACDQTSAVATGELDPFALIYLKQLGIGTESYFALGFLSSPAIQIFGYDDRRAPKEALRLITQFSLKDMLGTADELKGFKFFTRSFSLNANDLYVLVEGLYATDKKRMHRSFVIKVDIDKLINSKSLASTDVGSLPLEPLHIETVQDLYANGGKVYVLGRMPVGLFKIDWASKKAETSSPVCSGATSLTVSNNDLYVPCFTDNRVDRFELSRLHFKQAVRLGFGPAQIVLDPTKKKLFTSLPLRGQVVVSNPDTLERLRYVFPKSPNNRTGS